MNLEKEILDVEVMREILEAGKETLSFALLHSFSLPSEDDPGQGVRDSIEKALHTVKAALGDDRSEVAIKGFVANALIRLRTALGVLQGLSTKEGLEVKTECAVARAISLLYPLTKSDGALDQAPRKSRRRQQAVAKRRKQHRPNFNIKMGRDSNHKFFTGFESDIAFGGLFISTYDIHPVGTKIRISAEIGADRVLMGTAKVVWVREANTENSDMPPGMGVAFNYLPQAAKEEINQYLENHETLFYDAV